MNAKLITYSIINLFTLNYVKISSAHNNYHNKIDGIIINRQTPCLAKLLKY